MTAKAHTNARRGGGLWVQCAGQTLPPRHQLSQQPRLCVSFTYDAQNRLGTTLTVAPHRANQKGC